MFGSAVPEVACRTAHVLLTFTLFVFVWVEWGVEVRGNCSFFLYYCHCEPSLFQLSLLDNYVTFRFNTVPLYFAECKYILPVYHGICSYLTAIVGVVASTPASSAVDHWFEPLSCQTKDYKIGICCSHAKHVALRTKSKNWSLGIRIMCPSGATCLSADCCFSALTLWISKYACV